MKGLLVGVSAIVLFAGWAVYTAPEADGASGTITSTAQEAGREIVVPGSQLFSRVVRAGDFLFLSGALGLGRGAERGAGPETQRALESIQGLLEQAESGIDDIVKCTVFLAEIADYGAMNEVYGAFFGGTPPARSALAVKELVNSAAVEIECMAYAPKG